MSIAEQLAGPSYQMEGFSFYTDCTGPEEYPLHQHPELELILILNSASAIVSWDDNGQQLSQTIEQESLCLIPSNQPHAMGWPQKTEYIIMFIHPELLNRKAQDFAINCLPPTTGQYGIQDPLIYSLSTALQSSIQAEGTIESLYIDTLINTLLIYFLKNYAGCQWTTPGTEPIQYQRWLKDVLDYIHDALDQDLRLSTLARIAKMSESSFCHLFKEYMDISPHQYVIQERIILAKQLLLRREMSIAEISVACGFNSQSHLTYYFRQHTGITPKVYRQSH